MPTAFQTGNATQLPRWIPSRRPIPQLKRTIAWSEVFLRDHERDAIIEDRLSESLASTSVSPALKRRVNREEKTLRVIDRDTSELCISYRLLWLPYQPPLLALLGLSLLDLFLPGQELLCLHSLVTFEYLSGAFKAIFWGTIY